jgi:hypothetical protein
MHLSSSATWFTSAVSVTSDSYFVKGVDDEFSVIVPFIR